jgi:hypothetical protein
MLVPTFHPAAALRGGDRVTDQMREDFALVRSILDNPRQEEPTPEPEIEPEQIELFG